MELHEQCDLCAMCRLSVTKAAEGFIAVMAKTAEPPVLTQLISAVSKALARACPPDV